MFHSPLYLIEVSTTYQTGFSSSTTMNKITSGTMRHLLQDSINQIRARQEELEMPNKTEIETDTTSIQIRELRKGEVLPRKVRNIRKRYEVDTRKTIEKAIRNLEKVAEEAHKRATSTYLPTEARQKWARIEAYIYQVINSLAKNYDSQTIMERIEELSKIVEELMEEDPRTGEKG